MARGKNTPKKQYLLASKIDSRPRIEGVTRLALPAASKKKQILLDGVNRLALPAASKKKQLLLDVARSVGQVVPQSSTLVPNAEGEFNFNTMSIPNPKWLIGAVKHAKTFWSIPRTKKWVENQWKRKFITEKEHRFLQASIDHFEKNYTKPVDDRDTYALTINKKKIPMIYHDEPMQIDEEEHKATEIEHKPNLQLPASASDETYAQESIQNRCKGKQMSHIKTEQSKLALRCKFNQEHSTVGNREES